MNPELPELEVKTGGKYQKINRQMLILALDGLSLEASCNQIHSPEWKFYKNIIENLTKALEKE